MIRWIGIPLISAVIGYLTNYIAVKMLFRPLYPVKFAGFTIWGLIPKRREDIARKIAETVHQELISPEVFSDTIQSIELNDEMEHLVEKILEERVKKVILESYPVAALIIDGLIAKFKGIIAQEMILHMGTITEKLADKFQDKIDLSEIVMAKINSFDMEYLETMVFKLASSELKHIEILGGVLGFLIGLIQVSLITWVF